MKKYFGTDGIRGVVGDETMNKNMAFRLGQAMVLFCIEYNIMPKIIIGHDTRRSANELQSAVIAGIKKAGGEVELVGIIPTPGLALLAKEEEVGLGLMITASHNNYRYNGFKVFNNKGEKISDSEEARIEKLIDKAEKILAEYEFKQDNKINKKYKQKYEVFLHDVFKDDDFSDLKVVLDCAHGATYRIAPNIFEKLTHTSNPLFISPDEKNINHNCGSQFPQTLAKKVVEEKANIGLAFDGDGDRIIVVDEQGKILTGDHILYIIGKMMKMQGELQNNTIVSTVMSNIGFIKALEAEEIKYIQTDVGDRTVCLNMKESGASLGGEEAGHIVLSNYHTSGDGILSGLMMLRALKYFDKPLSELAEGLTFYPKVLKNIKVKSKPEIESVPEIIKLIRKIEVELKDEGRVLVRYSGTESKCRVMVEGKDEKRTEEQVDRIINKINQVIN